MSTISADATQTIRLRNTSNEEQELSMEPLGDGVPLKPNELHEITVTDALDEIDFSPDGFTVYGWVTCIKLIKEDGGASAA